MQGGGFERVAVVSSSQTEWRVAWDGVQHVELIFSAVTDALRGSGLRIDDVDTVINSGSDVLDGRSISNCGFLGAMGAHHKEESRVEEDGLWAALYAINKIASGGSGVAVVLAYSKPSESDVATYYSSIAEPFYQRPVGLDHLVAAGIMANQYLASTGAAEDVFADVAAHDWSMAATNGRVQTPVVPGRDAIAGADYVAEPLRAWEVSRPLDGAVAVVLAAEGIARRSPRPVWITGAGSAMDSHMLTARAPGRLEACAVAAQTAYRRAGIADPSVVGMAEVSGGSAAGELMVLEALGLAAHGHAGELYGPSSRVDVNPSGGAIPADPIMATGLVRLAEVSRRLADGASASPAVVHGAGGIGMQNHCVLTLEV